MPRIKIIPDLRISEITQYLIDNKAFCVRIGVNAFEFNFYHRRGDVYQMIQMSL